MCPFKVLSELNDLKYKAKQKLSDKLSKANLYTAQGRVDWKEFNKKLHAVCTANHAIDSWNPTHSSQFLGQSALEEFKFYQMIEIRDSDDKILNFAHQLRSKLGFGSSVVILTDDVNFRNRANATFDKSDIPAHHLCQGKFI